ncbi:MAG: hypothetical protein DHS20C07_12970 [Methyloligella sp.]|nr:MAG: hypothetical protein DHS20C07_12970 [Methyloligella sp.]
MDELRIGLTHICAKIINRLLTMYLFMAHTAVAGALSVLFFALKLVMKVFSRGSFYCVLSQTAKFVAKVSFLLFSLIFTFSTAQALEPIELTTEIERIEITKFSEHYKGAGDTLQVETARDADGISNRMAVKAQTPNTDPKWIVFALKNNTDKQIVRVVTTDRYNIVGSRILRPDLDAKRLIHLTPSVGFLPLRIPNDAVDIFSITIEPGSTVTFVAELSNSRFPRVFLWHPLALSKKLRDMALFNGIMLGIVGILAIFLTAVFVANHKAIFPATAFIAWCVGAYLCVDFGFWHKLFRLDPEMNSLYRAGSEAAIASSLVVFLYTFLRLRFWHGWIKLLFGVWILGQFGLIALAVLDPVLVSGLARLSLLAIGGLGSLLIGYLAIRGQDRALALVPTWLLFVVWLFGAGVATLGQLSGDIVAPALTSGLVLILVLLGFTVTQFAFRSFEPLAGAPPSQLQLRSLALEGAGAAVWQWNSRRDEISVSPEVEDVLGLHEGELTCRVEQWMQYLHPSDRERFRLLMRTLQEKNGGELQLEFRMRGHEGHFLWYELRAHSVTMPHQRSLRCVGLMRDITDGKRSQERLLGDAVHDSLTGLPNRELFLDRLQIAITRVKDEGGVRPPTILFVDIDRFKHVNQSFGMVIGDTMLLTIARRLQRHLGPQDSLARINGDQFAVLLVTENNPQEIALLAERIRRSLRSPMKIGGKEIILTGSIGIAVYDGTQLSHQDLVNEAELAMYRAKRSGTDRIEIFKPTMRGERDNRLALESDLRRAIERRQIKVLYQPITKLKGEDLTGFEALIRWDHPKHGRLSPDEFIPIAEESDLISELGSYVLNQAVKDAVQWNRILPRADEPLIVSINISSRELFRQELYQEVRMILTRESLPENSLRLEVTESLVMENPEGAVEILGWLRNAGASLALDDFGTGYSSLSYLHRFPFDTLKVDRSIVHNVSSGKTGPAILRSVVALASELNMGVVAEGVESEEDVTFLRSIGCGYAQGFYFGEPMNQKDVIYLLEALAKDVKIKGRSGLFGAIRSKTGADAKQIVKEDQIQTTDVSREENSVNGHVPQGEAAEVPVLNSDGTVMDYSQTDQQIANEAGSGYLEQNTGVQTPIVVEQAGEVAANGGMTGVQPLHHQGLSHNQDANQVVQDQQMLQQQNGHLPGEVSETVGQKVDPSVAAALANLQNSEMKKQQPVGMNSADHLQAGQNMDPGHTASEDAYLQKHAALSEQVSQKVDQGLNQGLGQVSGQEPKRTGLNDALKLAEQAAVAGSTGAVRKKVTKNKKSQKIKGQVSAPSPQGSGDLNPKVMDVYAQLASGGTYSDVGEQPSAGTVENKERKFNFNNAPLNGAPQAGDAGVNGQHPQGSQVQASHQKGTGGPKGAKPPKKGNKKGKR